MPFEFLKYLQPTHYFQLNTNTDKSVFPKVNIILNSKLHRLFPGFSFYVNAKRKSNIVF